APARAWDLVGPLRPRRRVAVARAPGADLVDVREAVGDVDLGAAALHAEVDELVDEGSAGLALAVLTVGALGVPEDARLPAVDVVPRHRVGDHVELAGAEAVREPSDAHALRGVAAAARDANPVDPHAAVLRALVDVRGVDLVERDVLHRRADDARAPLPL